MSQPNTEDIGHEVVATDTPAGNPSGVLQLSEDADSRITSEIKKFNLADSKIAELKEKCESLTIPALPADGDAEGWKAWRAALKAAKAGRTVVTKTRTAINNKREELKSDYLKIGRGIDDEAKRLKALVEPIEEMMDERIEAAENAEKERKEAAIRAEEAKTRQRVEALIEAGIRFTGSFYEIGEIAMGVDNIKSLPDEAFEALRARVVKAKADEVAAEAERARIAEEERQAAIEREAAVKRKEAELEAERKKMEEERAALAKEKADHEAAVEKARKEREAENERIANEARERIINERRAAVEGLGLAYSSAFQYYALITKSGEVDIKIHEITEATTETWPGILETLTNQVSEIKKNEDKRIADEAATAKHEKTLVERLARRLLILSGAGFQIDHDGQLATYWPEWTTKAESLNVPFALIKGMEVEQWDSQSANWLETAASLVKLGSERKAEQAAKAEADRQAALSDWQKAREYAAAIRAVQMPELSNEFAAGIMKQFGNHIDVMENLFQADPVS